MDFAVGMERNLRQQQRRNYDDEAIGDDEIEGKRTFSVEEKLHSSKFEEETFVKSMKGTDFNLKFVQENRFTSPVVCRAGECSQGLDMRMPSTDFSVTDVKNFIGARRMVDVIDVNTQQALEMTLQQWVKYYTSPEKERILNVISLEFSHTRLQDHVEPPKVVGEMDWVSVVWPRHFIEEQTDSTNSMNDMKYPKVKRYCLMSVGGCYTDFHVDFGGTSVWYHIMKGSKVFWLIPPTENNLQLYERWVLSGKQQDVFFGDQVEKCSRVYLGPGDTFFIPNGWIHAVFTPEDSLVFGGNFLHSFAIMGQLRVNKIEDNTKVPQKFRYPLLAQMWWYVVEKYTKVLARDKEERLKTEKTKTLDPKEKGGVKKVTNKESVKGKAAKKAEDKGTDRNGELRKVNGDTSMPTKAADEEPETTDGSRRRSRRVAKSKESADKVDDEEVEDQTAEKKEGRGRGRKKVPKKKVKEEEKEAEEEVEEKTKIRETQVDVNGDVNGEQEDSGELKQAHTAEEEKKAWVPVYLTKVEIEGLTMLIDKLRTSSAAKKSVPSRISDAEGLLRQLEELLQMHKNDDPKLSASGIQHLHQIDPPPIKKNPLKRLLSRGPMMGTKVGPGIRKRRTRCGQCDNCQREDCGDCRTCKDMKKFGGAGRMKQSCLKRSCTNPNLPTCTRCSVCAKDSNEESRLMECRLCSEIAHPPCLDVTGHYKVVEEINDCWECPKCCKDETAPVHKKGQKVVYTQVKAIKRKHSQELTSPSKSTKKVKNGTVIEKGKRHKDGVPEHKGKRSRITSGLSDDESEESNDEDASSSVQLTETTAARGRRAILEPRPPPKPPAEVKPKFVIRPVPPDPPPKSLALENGEKHALERDIWLRVFSFLDINNLSLCMRVCRTWNRWCMDQRFWFVVDLSDKKVVTPSALRGIVRRQPRTLNLSWTNVTYKQLVWLLTRLPRLQELYLSGTTSATAYALIQVNCPRLNLLSLSWSDGITDVVLKKLVNPLPPAENRSVGPGQAKSRMRSLVTLFLSGCDVTGNSLRALAQYCPKLRKLDVSYCAGITDQDIEELTNYASPARDTLAEVLLSGCPKLTDSSLAHLERCPCIVRLDVRSCSGVTRDAVEKYAESRDLPFEITDGKLILLKG